MEIAWIARPVLVLRRNQYTKPATIRLPMLATSFGSSMVQAQHDDAVRQ